MAKRHGLADLERAQRTRRRLHLVAHAIDVDDDVALADRIDQAFELADHGALPRLCSDAVAISARGTGHGCITHRLLRPAGGDRLRARAMAGVTYGNGQRIGLVRALEPGLRQQEADHHLDLLLLRVAGADHGLLDDVGRILGNPQAALGRGQQRHAPRLAELQCRAGILVDEGLLDRRFLRLEARDHAAEALVELAQAIGQFAVAVRGHMSAGHVREPHAVRLHDAPPRAAEAGIDADDANRGCAHDP